MTPSSLLSFRDSLNLNTHQLANLLGVTAPCVSQWLSGKYKIPTMAVNLINALKIIEELRQPRLPLPIPAGECQCGCRGKTIRNHRSDSAKGWVRGEYRAFISGHNASFKRAK